MKFKRKKFHHITHVYVSIMYSDGRLIARNSFIVYVFPFPLVINTNILLSVPLAFVEIGSSQHRGVVLK